MIHVASTISRMVGDRYENGKIDRATYRARESIAQAAEEQFGRELPDTAISHSTLNGWLNKHLKMEFA